MKVGLFKLLQKNNHLAQKQVFDLYAEQLFVLALRYVFNEQDAASIVNQSFFKAFAKIKGFSNRGEGAFAAWLRQITVNESLMHLRRTKNLIFSDDENMISSKLTEDIYCDESITTEDCLKLLEKLPVGFRTVFNLYAIEGYSHKEIGEQLGITESASRSQLSRARKLLQQLILEEY